MVLPLVLCRNTPNHTHPSNSTHSHPERAQRRRATTPLPQPPRSRRIFVRAVPAAAVSAQSLAFDRLRYIDAFQRNNRPISGIKLVVVLKCQIDEVFAIYQTEITLVASETAGLIGK